MNRDQTLGVVILLVSLLGIAVYGWLLYAYSTFVLEVTAFIAVAGLLAIGAWIGYTMATTPPPAPLENQPLPPQVETASAENPPR
jgi:predicted DNA-binding transcriptional regulator